MGVKAQAQQWGLPSNFVQAPCQCAILRRRHGELHGQKPPHLNTTCVQPTTFQALFKYMLRGVLGYYVQSIVLVRDTPVGALNCRTQY